MGILVTVLTLIAAILMILIVLVQNSKGGGLSSTFASSNQVMGVRKTTDFLEKATWTLAIALVILSLASHMFDGAPKLEASQSILQNKVEEAAISPTAPSAPANAPAEAPSAPSTPTLTPVESPLAK